MVLIRTLIAMLVVMSAACGQSLFDAHGDRRGDGGVGDDAGDGGDIPIPVTCPDPCIADAAADFNGTATGNGNRWRYLDDHRDRTWAPMTPLAGVLVGADPLDRISSCSRTPAGEACATLPGALLISSGGATANDPSLEFRYAGPAGKVIQLSLRVLVPRSSAKQRVRLYRNSREDVLFTVEAAPDVLVEHALLVDAIASDRFLIAIEPIAGMGSEVGLQFFISGRPESFPSTCKLAVPFSVPGTASTRVDDLCGGEVDSLNNTDTTFIAPALIADPFGQANLAAYLEPGLYYRAGAAIPPSSARTVQLWAQLEGPPTPQYSYLFSDIDQDSAKGFSIRFSIEGGPLKLEAAVIETVSPLKYVGQSFQYPMPLTTWHFIRAVHSNGMVSLCLDGVRVGGGPLPGPSASTSTPYFGKNGKWDQSNWLYGNIDDVRVFSTALPCE